MKATKPFNQEFRIELEAYEAEMTETVTKESQFEALYNNLFENVLGSVSWVNSTPSTMGLQGAMVNQITNGRKISELSGTSDLSSGGGYEYQLESYRNLPNRPLTSNEADILISDLNEWFNNSGFPGFTITKNTINHDSKIYFVGDWVNIS